MLAGCAQQLAKAAAAEGTTADALGPPGVPANHKVGGVKPRCLLNAARLKGPYLAHHEHHANTSVEAGQGR
jgi:hypothetical protein